MKSNKQISKVVVLDVDGVLCLGGPTLARPCLNNLKRIVTDGVDIVVSSTWRLYQSHFNSLCGALHEYGMPKPVGVTPDLSTENQTRAYEILEWLDKHPEAKQWVILDDYKLDLETYDERIVSHFVNTVFKDGLTDEKATEAIAILNA